MSIAVFLPTREGSRRVPHKNTRPFSDIPGGLLELKLRQLRNLKVDEIILSTDDVKSIEIAEKFEMKARLKIDKRPAYLAHSDTDLSDLISYVGKLTNCDHILWTHATSPFINREIYHQAIDKYFDVLKKGYDSLATAKIFKTFLWDPEKNDLINRATEDKKWPATQDLKKLYEINSAIFLAPRELYLTIKNRIGNSPYILELNDFQSLDIDWVEDFEIAEAVYERFYK
ncbi:acylneuraminate cytidylyltransferase family protein [Salegentibacter mishustinae]|uniref:Acylneuraminate cytidylyltransferase n=1 Tax=Salegentibacter mishustinae TaxID=270918 RepID=A0A0Q9ZJW1_9FLAO|nr:hypothetical protein [Salegentibacter mishustinae]KRG29169.1 hypothetical protein APR42_04355 [Salegentibacter mishustinae]PNW21779.1 hypothetical protein APB85_11130 [Salegentibacter mishustinae]PZX65122.1 N-acylneuraminate cytidylyltransferase [Salegentibacter mishustinae]GGW87186.1 hypothetical protein GCM10008086_14600 [Salegentibacter mishustinae]